MNLKNIYLYIMNIQIAMNLFFADLNIWVIIDYRIMILR